MDEDTRKAALKAIEDIVNEQIGLFLSRDDGEEEGNNEGPAFVYPNFGHKDNAFFDPVAGIMMPNLSQPLVTVTAWDSPQSQDKYMRIMRVLSIMHSLLTNQQRVTKRELFYSLLNCTTGKQSQIDDVITTISAMLQIPRGQLGIVATSKGLIRGSISYEVEDVRIDCSMSTEMVPMDIDCMSEICSEAELVVVVEKDATFQRLVDEGFLDCGPYKSLLITGKGVPDLNTRKLVYRLANGELSHVPFVILVDGDPFGIEIMCVYRFGSRTMTWCAEPLAVPGLHWIGVHPSDFGDLEAEQTRPLTQMDHSKLASLLERPYMEGDLEDQLVTMLEWSRKTEIEDMESPSEYIWSKIAEKQWI